MLGSASDVTNEDVKAEALRYIDLATSVMPGRLGAVTQLAIEVAALREVLSVAVAHNIVYTFALVFTCTSLESTRSGRLIVVSIFVIFAPRIKSLQLLGAARKRLSLLFSEATASIVVLER